MKILWTASIVAAGLCTLALAQANKSSLLGAWRVSEVTTKGKNGGTNKSPQPGLFLFTGRHYSIMTVTSDKARPQVQDTAKASAKELLDVWGPFTANSGTYDVSGNTLTTHPIVAKNPGVMAPGVSQGFSFQVEGNSLTLTQTQDQKGKVQNGNVIKLTRAE